jgi:hypothetical protein
VSDIPDSGSFNLGLANIASQNYGPAAVTTQANQNANTQLTAQQAQAVALENQVTRARQPLILAKLHAMQNSQDDQSGVESSGGPADVPEPLQQAIDRSGAAEDSILNPGAIDEMYRRKYLVPVVPPGAMNALQDAQLVDPTDKNGMGPKSLMGRIEMWKAQQTQAAQVSANTDFDKLVAATNAPEGQAMNVLRASHPEVYDALKKKFAKDPDEDRDEEDQARLFAAHAAGAVHQYTGRPAKEVNGTYRDEVTGIPIPGVEKVGLSTEQYLNLAHQAIAPTQMDDGNGGKVTVPAWKAAKIAGVPGINGPGDWVMVNASQQGLPGAAATLSPNSAQKQEARKIAATAVAKAQTQQGAAPSVGGTPPMVNGVGPARNAQGNIDPKLTTALQDPAFDYKPSLNGKPWESGGIGTTPPPTVLKDMDNQTEARNDLAKTTGQGVGAAAAALTMYKAAQDVLAKGRYDGGAWNAELAKFSRWLPAGWQDHLTGDYQEVAKYLGNAALQSGKGIFSKMTEKESDAVMHDLNPSPNMDPGALRDMIARGVSTAQYSLDSAKRVPAYLRAGLDANQFGTWNQTHFPMEVATAPKTEAAPSATPKYSDEKVRAYMKKHGLTDEQATRKALGM